MWITLKMTHLTVGERSANLFQSVAQTIEAHLQTRGARGLHMDREKLVTEVLNHFQNSNPTNADSQQTTQDAGSKSQDTTGQRTYTRDQIQTETERIASHNNVTDQNMISEVVSEVQQKLSSSAS
jgi:hypothetical protein